MRIFARKHPYSRLRIDSRMDVPEEPEYPKISGGLQLMIALETIPYFTTVIITSVLVSYVLDHPEVEWADVFAWRCASFAGFSFMTLSLANYGDRVMNGRYFLFLLFLGFCLFCMVFIFYAEKEVALLVFACCIQPLLIIRDASRLCYIVQILRASERSSKIRTLCFFLFLMSNLGAFFRAATFSASQDSKIKIWGCIGSLISYMLLSFLVFVFGSNVVAHRNIVERGFRCVVWKFENVLRAIIRKLCKCFLARLKEKDYRSLYDEEIVTCVDCMLKMSATLCPLVLYFATAEMTFFVWVRDYDVFVDLGFQDWPISLADVYHGFNVVSILTTYVIVIPIIQCFIHVPDVCIICLSYFTLCLSWVTAASLQYGNELRQTHYAIANESKVLVFTSTLEPVLLDVSWSDKRWLHSGNFSVNYVRLNATNTTDLVPWKAKIWLDKTPPGDPKQNVQSVSNPGFLITKNHTECYLLVWDSHALQKKRLWDLDQLFQSRTKARGKLNGTLVTLCSTNLYESKMKHYLVIQDLRTEKFQTQQVCNSNKYEAVTNLTIGWYMLYLREDDQFVPFQMQVNVRKGAVHYLYIKKGNETFAPYVGNFTNIVAPFFVIGKMYVLLQIGLFSLAYGTGMVAVHAFVVGATPKHLLEFGFAILYTSRALGSGVAAIFLSYVTPNSRGMFMWVLMLIVGLLLMVRNAWVYLSTGGQCGPEVQYTKEEPEEESSESDSDDEQDIDTFKAPGQLSSPDTEQTPEPEHEPSPKAKNQTQNWFSRRKKSSSRKNGSSSPQHGIPVKNSAPVTGKRPSLQPEPSEKLETLTSWFSKRPQPVPNPAPTLDNEQPTSSSQLEPEYDSSSGKKTKK